MLLRYADFEWRGVVDKPDDNMMDVPANNSNGQLIEMARRFGTHENRKAQRAVWHEWAQRKMSHIDRNRRKGHDDVMTHVKQSVTTNRAKETAEALRDTKHRWRVYSDGGCDGNGAKGIWGKAGHDAVIYACTEDETVTEVANIFGLVVIDVRSE